MLASKMQFSNCKKAGDQMKAEAFKCYVST